MIKEFEYKGHNFIIEVILNKNKLGLPSTLVHTVIINCKDFDNYYIKEEVIDDYLIEYVESCESLAKKHIDIKLNRPRPIQVERLTNLGFK